MLKLELNKNAIFNTENAIFSYKKVEKTLTKVSQKRKNVK